MVVVFASYRFDDFIFKLFLPLDSFTSLTGDRELVFNCRVGKEVSGFKRL
jgi:hypothetical protein